MNASDARTANLLGAYALRASDLVGAALASAPGLGGSDAAALLTLLAWADGHNLEALRRGLALSQPGAVHLVDRLVALGLAERERGAADRREVRVRLTGAGRERAEELLALRAAALAPELAALTPRERARLAELLGRLLGAATDGRERARRICRLCDAAACGHPERCPVTRAAAGAA